MKANNLPHSNGSSSPPSGELEGVIFTQHLIDKAYSPSTREGILKVIKQFNAWLIQNNLTIETTTYNHILNYLQYLQQRGNKQITINSKTIYIKHYLNYLVHNNYIPHNPILAIKIQGIKREMIHNILSPEELEKIYNDYSNEPKQHAANKRVPPQELNNLARLRNKIILGLLIYQGVTVHDLSHIQPQHINIKQGLIIIPGTRKSNERTLKLQAHQIFDIHQYITEVRPQILLTTGKQSNQLIISVGTSLHIRSIMQKLFSELRKQTNTIINVDQIRASVISHWIKQYNLRQAQYMAGHRYVSSTERYKSNNMEELQDIINQCSLQFND